MLHRHPLPARARAEISPERPSMFAPGFEYQPVDFLAQLRRLPRIVLAVEKDFPLLGVALVHRR